MDLFYLQYLGSLLIADRVGEMLSETNKEFSLRFCDSASAAQPRHYDVPCLVSSGGETDERNSHKPRNIIFCSPSERKVK